MSVTGTSGKDFIHQSGDGRSAPFGYTDNPGLTGGEDTVNALGGDDLIYMGSHLDAGDAINGGDGNDTVELSGDYFSQIAGTHFSHELTLGSGTLQNVETLQLDPGIAGHNGILTVYNGYNITLNAAAPSPLIPYFTVEGSLLGGNNAMTVDGSAATYSLDIIGGAGPNTLTGGSNNDSFTLGTIADLAHSNIDGKGGNNSLTFNASGGSTLDLPDPGLKNIQQFFFQNGDFTVTAGNGQTPTGGTLYLDAPSSHSFTFDGHARTDGSFLVYGSRTGDNVITGGAQADTLIGGSANNEIAGGGGDDGIAVDITPGVIERIDGGDGNDTVTLTDANFPNSENIILDDVTLQNVETLDVVFIGSLTMADGNVAAGQTLQVVFEVTAPNAAAIMTFDGSAETDGAYNFNLNGLAGSGGANSVTGGGGNDIYRLFDVNHSGPANSWNGGGGSNTLDYSTDIQSLTLDARSGTASGSGPVADHFTNFTVFKFGSGADTFYGSGAGETVYMLKGGIETAEGFGGNDHFFFGPTLGALDVVDGGEGNDVLTLDGDYSAGVTFNATTVTNVETIMLTAGHSYSFTTNNGTVAAGQRFTVNASTLAAGDSFTFNGAAETDGSFTILASAGANTLTGGAGADVISFATAGFNASDVVNGGTGTAIDGLSFTTNGYITAAAFGGVSHIERIFLSATASHNLTLPDALVASADDSHLLTVVGNSGHDTVNASAVLAGDSVRFEGGGAADRFIGGGGADIFYYFAPSDSTGDANGTLYDTLIHFNPAADHFDLPTGFSVTSVATVSSGSLSAGTGTFDSDMAAAIGSHLAAHTAVDCHVTGGNLSGHEFLVVNPTASNGYLSGADYVFDVTDRYTGAFTTGDFI